MCEHVKLVIFTLTEIANVYGVFEPSMIIVVTKILHKITVSTD